MSINKLINTVFDYEYEKGELKRASEVFFNLPDGWLSCLQRRREDGSIVFSLFLAGRLEDRGSFEVAIDDGRVIVIDFGLYLKVDFYILQLGFAYE